MWTPLESTRSALESLDFLATVVGSEVRRGRHATRRGRVAADTRVLAVVAEACARAAEVAPVAAQPAALRSTAFAWLDANGKRGVEGFLRTVEEMRRAEEEGALQQDAIFEDEPEETAKRAAWGLAHPTVWDVDPLPRGATRAERKRYRADIDARIINGRGFSGEERLGRYVDLHEEHELFQNVCAAFGGVSYLDFLARVVEGDVAPPAAQASTSTTEAKYRALLVALVAYFDDFRARARPLSRVAMSVVRRLKGEKPLWVSSSSTSTSTSTASATATTSTNATVDDGAPLLRKELLAATCAEDLIPCGMEPLKNALKLRGLPCGGTVAQRAARLFAAKDVEEEEAAAAAAATSSAATSATSASTTTTKRTILDPDVSAAAFDASTTGTKSASTTRLSMSSTPILEAALRDASKEFADTLQATRAFITRKLTMKTFEEIQKDAELEMEEGVYTSSEDEEGEGGGGEGDGADEDDEQALMHRYGVSGGGVLDPSTGKIIPKWMYRLHGLHRKFTCEICGNATYFGPRNWERHFREFKHTMGLKALGIPNTPQFHDVARIKDAQDLFAKLQREMKRMGATASSASSATSAPSSSSAAEAVADTRRGFVEETEDADGNVVRR